MDGCVRKSTSKEGLKKLRPAFDRINGITTPGSAAPLSNGSACVFICSKEYAEK